MAGGKQQQPLNPNWAQLMEKLKTNAPKHKYSKHSRGPATENQQIILAKRKERSGEVDSDSEPIKANPLIPTSTDCSVTDVVAMDCEMVGVGSEGTKSALGRVTLVNQWGNVIYDEYARPVDYVVDFRTEISGIRPQDLRKDADVRAEEHTAQETLAVKIETVDFHVCVARMTYSKDFDVVQKKVAELINGRILVGHAIRNDLKALLLSHPKNDIRDSAEYAPFLKEGRSRSLKNLALQFLDVEIQNGQHCPIEDSRAAMMLYQKNKKLWERTIKEYSRQKERKNKRGSKKRSSKRQKV